MEIQWLSKRNRTIAEVYNTGLQFCFISRDMKQCHDFVFCKDFLQDSVFSYLHSSPAQIYGFKYDPKTMPPICTKTTRIALANKSDKSFKNRIPAIRDFINQVNKKLRLKKTEILEVTNPPKGYEKTGVILTDGSPIWLNSPPMLSMYSLLLRCGFVHKEGDKFMDTINGIVSGSVKPYGSQDKTQLSGALAGINKILQIGYRPFFYIDTKKNYPARVGVGTMHSSAGIMGFSAGYSQGICSYWHRKSLKKRLEAKNETELRK